MRGNPGRLVIWTDSKGSKKYGVAYTKEQEAAFRNVKKVFVRYLNEDLTTKEKSPENGKGVVGLVDMEKITVIGYID